MGRRASTSQLEVKHGNFSGIKTPSRSRGASPAPGHSPRASPSASPTASPNRRMSEGGPIKDVALSREAYSKARNLLLAKRASREEGSEDEEHSADSAGFKRVGKALVTGMSQALFNRRGSARNNGLMKSLMAAISKEKILQRITELGLDDQVSEMLGEMYQGMVDLLIDNYEPLEGALGSLLDEAVTGSEDLESLVEGLREAVTGSLMAMMSKQEAFGVSISKAQELLLVKVVDAAQGMASEISYTMRMRGGSKKQRKSAPSASSSSLNLGDAAHSPRFASSAGMAGQSAAAAGSGNASGSAKHTGAGAAHHFKKTVRNMFMMNAIGGGPRFHTERRAEERKHHQPGAHTEDGEGFEDEDAHRGDGVDETHTAQARLEPEHSLDSQLDRPKGPEETFGNPDARVAFDSLSTSSHGTSASHQRPNTVAVDDQSISEVSGISEGDVSPSSRKSFPQSYGMPPSSGSGLTTPSNSVSIRSPLSSKARSDATQSLNPFGFSDVARDDSSSEDWAQQGLQSQDGGTNESQHTAIRENSKAGLHRWLEESDQVLPEGTPHVQNEEMSPIHQKQTRPRRQSKGRGGQLIHGRAGGMLWPDLAKAKFSMQNDRGGLYIGHHPGQRGKGRKASLLWDDPKRNKADKVAGAMPQINASGISGTGSKPLQQQSFDWETLRVQLLREGIKLKIPQELLHKGMKSREHSRVLLEEVQSDFHEAAFKEGMAKLDESSKDLEASLSGLRRDSSGKSLHSSTWHQDTAQSRKADVFSANPVSASCNATLHRARKSQDPVELEEVYKHRASPWTSAAGALPETTRHVPPLGLVPLVGRRRKRNWRKEERPPSGSRRFKHPILPFRSTCFDFSTDRLLPEIVTFPMVTEDFMESVYDLSLEHSRASWSDTNTLLELPARPVKTTKRGYASKSLQSFHKHFKSVMP